MEHRSHISGTAPISPGLDFTLRLARAQAATVRRLDASLGSNYGISFSDFMLLYYLDRAPGGRLRRVDLAERQGLTASGVTRTLLPLEKIGLVSRQPDPRDARVGYAAITATGQEMLNNAMVTAQQISADLLRGCPPDQVAAMSALLGQLAGMNSSNT
ncbi:MarR family winged helix-turn-helix transcriptional regulator [Rugamonas sp.]|uniref:MarR family winged helix-turn-helix transcriptional regulator n=1 Tax=Rugamonas sp. TaxID=1926287 RepID=UPI0025DBA6C8|nr:MarR family winged helix-turn-helix transcriptional regulator [Rugamonas sp.]